MTVDSADADSHTSAATENSVVFPDAAPMPRLPLQRHVRVMVGIAVILGAALHAPVCLAAQGTGTLSVTVTAQQTGVALPYAVVALPERAVERFTDAGGRATIIALPAGSYDIAVRRIGFAPYRGRVMIDAGTVTTAAP